MLLDRWGGVHGKTMTNVRRDREARTRRVQKLW